MNTSALPAKAPAAAPAAAPALLIPAGTRVGTMQENHFGVPQPPRPVLAGERVGPATGWASLESAVAAVRNMQPNQVPGHGPTDASGSAVAILRGEGRFFGQFLRQEGGLQDGLDIRLWHIPTQLTPTDNRWVTTVSGPDAP